MPYQVHTCPTDAFPVRLTSATCLVRDLSRAEAIEYVSGAIVTLDPARVLLTCTDIGVAVWRSDDWRRELSIRRAKPDAPVVCPECEHWIGGLAPCSCRAPSWAGGS